LVTWRCSIMLPLARRGVNTLLVRLQQAVIVAWRGSSTQLPDTDPIHS